MTIRFFTPFDKIRSRYLRAQLVAVLATAVDFSVTLLCKEVFGWYYVTAVGMGACCGASTAFLLNRHWVFASGSSPAVKQVTRYLLALAGSAVLNTAGTTWVTETFHSHYLLSKIGVAVFIGLTYSYFILKSFVFTGYEKK